MVICRGGRCWLHHRAATVTCLTCCVCSLLAAHLAKLGDLSLSDEFAFIGHDHPPPIAAEAFEEKTRGSGGRVGKKGGEGKEAVLQRAHTLRRDHDRATFYALAALHGVNHQLGHDGLLCDPRHWLLGLSDGRDYYMPLEDLRYTSRALANR